MVKTSNWKTEKISHAILYAVIGVAALVFLLFFMVGFSRPYSYDPSFNEPKLTSLLLWFVILVCALSLLIAVWALIFTARRKGRVEKVVNGVPAARITMIVVAGTLMVLALAFGLGSTESLMVNGKIYDHAVQLRYANMFVATSLIMLLLAAVAVAGGILHSYFVNRATMDDNCSSVDRESPNERVP